MAEHIIDNDPAEINWHPADIIERTVQNAKNLLMCHMWEVPYDRFRGFDPRLYDLPLPAFQTELLPELDRIMIYEPDVEVVSATSQLRADGTIYIRAVIDVKINENE